MARVHRPSLFFLTAALVLILDQASKFFVRNLLAHTGPVELIPGFFRLVRVWNPGVAFGLFAEHSAWGRYLFLLLSLGAVGVFYYLSRRGRSPWVCGLIAGGALGNLVDRLFYGKVFDFLDFYWKNYHWPAFNLADAAISVGVILFLLQGFSSPSPK